MPGFVPGIHVFLIDFEFKSWMAGHQGVYARLRRAYARHDGSEDLHMANITAAMVKDLRETTGAGMMDCKAALTETGGDMQAAQDWLRKKGLSKAAKKAGRVAAEGLIGVFVAPKKGAMVEVNSET